MVMARREESGSDWGDHKKNNQDLPSRKAFTAAALGFFVERNN
jgi:hypothetical protein